MLTFLQHRLAEVHAVCYTGYVEHAGIPQRRLQGVYHIPVWSHILLQILLFTCVSLFWISVKTLQNFCVFDPGVWGFVSFPKSCVISSYSLLQSKKKRHFLGSKDTKTRLRHHSKSALRSSSATSKYPYFVLSETCYMYWRISSF